MATPLTFSARPQHSKVVGRTGQSIVAGSLNDLDVNQEVRGPLWYGSATKLGFSQRMLKDGVVQLGLGSLVDSIVGGTWTFAPASDSPLDREVADGAHHAFFERLPWASTASRIVTGVVMDGFSHSEVTDDVQEISQTRFPLHPGKGKAVMYTGLHARPAWSSSPLPWYPHPKNPEQLEKWQQFTSTSMQEPAGFVDIDASDLLRFTWGHGIAGASFNGQAIARAGFSPWFHKTILLVLAMIQNEREKVGVPKLSAPKEIEHQPDQDDRTVAMQILTNFRTNENSGLYLPPGWLFDWTSNKSPAALQDEISRCDTHLLQAFSSGHLALGHSSGKSRGGASFALASSQEGVQHLRVDHIARFMLEVLNIGMDSVAWRGESIVSRWVRANYGLGVPIPKAVCRALPSRDFSAMIMASPNLVAAGLLTPDDPLESHIREIMTFPERDPKTSRSVNQTMLGAAGQQSSRGEDATEPSQTATDRAEETGANQ